MARQNGFEIEKTLARKSCNSTTHGKTITDRHNTDFWLMQFIDQRHIRENIRVTHMIKCRRIFEMKYQAVRITHRLSDAVFCHQR
ncbi:hypothetical protein D3C80_1976860 [compost metagenome]